MWTAKPMSSDMTVVSCSSCYGIDKSSDIDKTRLLFNPHFLAFCCRDLDLEVIDPMTLIYMNLNCSFWYQKWTLKVSESYHIKQTDQRDRKHNHTAMWVVITKPDRPGPRKFCCRSHCVNISTPGEHHAKLDNLVRRPSTERSCSWTSRTKSDVHCQGARTPTSFSLLTADCNQQHTHSWPPCTFCTTCVHCCIIVTRWRRGLGVIEAWSSQPTGFLLQWFDTVVRIIWPVKIVLRMTHVSTVSCDVKPSLTHWFPFNCTVMGYLFIRPVHQ